ncbi:hypothetical protein DFH09DRAFT_1316166 [Mycena vulgaris]|nr:hypothetical protein DFH09DRAFT_1332372 [Mycena vulgaris]KAJ6561040.1 hypothetical protein DFH09DRAFT_1316166 [Mycena vulgaris]
MPSLLSDLHKGESYDAFRAWLLDPSARMSALKSFLLDSPYRTSLPTTQAEPDSVADVDDLPALIPANTLDSPSQCCRHCRIY